MTAHRPFRGFTLIELLVVISIIALLSSVVMASLNAARSKARDARRMADMHVLRTAAESYFSQNGSYPVCSGAPGGVGYACAMAALVSGGFLPSSTAINDPRHPAWQYEYDNYCANPAGSTDRQFRFWANAENSQQGGSVLWWTNFFIGATNCVDAS